MNFIDLQRSLDRYTRALHAARALLVIGMILVMVAAGMGGYLYGRDQAWWAFGWFLVLYVLAGCTLATATTIKDRAARRFHTEIRA